MQKQKIYLVGGAVRDRLLGLPVSEKDWVIVGGSAEKLIAAGFKQIGKDFPVFLHPETKEEYALARTEQKKGIGHKGFSFRFEKSISIEEDLKRRDLTINAIAQDSDGNIIDPWGGQKDLRLRKIRHVSDAFIEDPLRLFRTARFKAKFSELGFNIAPETLEIMKMIVSTGEIAYLTPERIWGEIEKALITNSPQAFFSVLYHCGAMEKIFHEVNIHIDKQIDSTLNTLKISASLSPDGRVRFAAMVYPLFQNSKETGKIFKAIFARLKIPKKYTKLINRVEGLAPKYLKIMELNGKELAFLLESLDSIRNYEEISLAALSCEAIFHESIDRDNRLIRFDYLIKVLKEFKKSNIKTISKVKLTGKEYGYALFKARVSHLTTWINSQKN